MAEYIASNAIEKVLEYLGQSISDTVASYFGGRKRLDELQDTIEIIQARLFDAETLREGEQRKMAKVWLKRLKMTLYKLEDLLEEVILDNERNKQTRMTKMPRLLLNAVFTNQVSFSHSQEVDAILKELDRIKVDMNAFNFKVCPTSHNHISYPNKRKETNSLIMVEEVIGRDEDKNMVIELLLDQKHEKTDLTVISIIGMGGIGKTTLAQLVYNDQRVHQYFEIKHWVCISDERCDDNELLQKILQSMIEDDCHELGITDLQLCLKNVIKGKKFLLVLDDMWDEDCDRWRQLKCLLCGGKGGSKILVTSRSEVVALNMSTLEPYELKGLVGDKSWQLFKALAFREGQEETNQNFTSIGKKIVKKCGNVPLAIRTIAGILFSRRTEEEWMHFKDKDIGMIDQNESNIMPTLKVSYDHLPPQLKQCFAYCSLFNADYEFDIQRLIWLWMAQGFVVSQNAKSPYGVGYEFFMQLLRRGFFHDVRRDLIGRMVSCKMHDLMNELAKRIGDEFLLVEWTSSIKHVNYNIRHVHVTNRASSEAQACLLAQSQMQFVRSYMQSLEIPIFGLRKALPMSNLNEVFSCLRRVRALDLGSNAYEGLPDTIGELKHLRYLRVRVHCLPMVITRLPRLETLDLSGSQLSELPKGFHKLTTLKHLLLNSKYLGLQDMPPYFGELESLEVLNKYVVGKNNGLDALSKMNLIGELTICYHTHRKNALLEAKKTNLKDKNLTSVTLLGSLLLRDVPFNEFDELLACLQPPETLKSLEVCNWYGKKFPNWGMIDSPCSLPNLVSVYLRSCTWENLPLFSQLHHLKILKLQSLDSLEYAEVIDISSNESSSSASTQIFETTTTYFPCLKVLWLCFMPELKGWSKIKHVDIDRQRQHIQQLTHYFFPSLSEMHLFNCPKLICMPPMAVVEPRSLPMIQDLAMIQRYSTLETLYICGCEDLDLWDMNVTVNDDDHIGKGKGYCLNSSTFWRCMKSLRKLTLGGVSKLKSLPSGIGDLSALQELGVGGFPNLKSLPISIGRLIKLNSLTIAECPKLEALPNSISSLTALSYLHIWSSEQLKSRCKERDGEDWPLIRHIPYIDID